MNETRRFSCDLLAPPRPHIRIRTWSDSVAETATPEEQAWRDTDLLDVDRCISAASSCPDSLNNSNEEAPCAAPGERRRREERSQERRRHSTFGFLATQSLALFLSVPTPHPHPSNHQLAAMTHDDLICPRSTLDNDVNEKQDNESVTSRGSSSRGSSDLNSSSAGRKKAKTWRRKLSNNLSGARLKASMALRRNTVATASVSTDKLAEVAASAVNRSLLLADVSMTIQPPSPASTSSNNSDNGNTKKSSLDLTALDTDRDYQLKKYSQSTPALPQLQYDLRNLGGSKSWQKKFLRHFTQVSRDERVLNHYSCALVGDLLLQGQLYITYNYFAFYSNVFGYVTRVLIPISEVRSITKEKTAKIIPNALAICTDTEKHVFSSLMSRDVAYKLAWSVWKKFHGSNPADEPDGGEGSSQHSSNESASQHSVEGIIISPPHAGNNGAFTSVTEGTSSEFEDNDSAISCSPTPEREVDKEDVLASFSCNELKAKPPSQSTSYLNLFNLFSSANPHGKADHPSNAKHLSSKDTVDSANNRLAASSPADGTKVEDHHWSWTHFGIGLLLVTLCLSAGLLWYRIYLLHSHLELRLSSENFIEDQLKPAVQSLYSPQMQELVDNLHVLLTSRSSNEDRKNLAR